MTVHNLLISIASETKTETPNMPDLASESTTPRKHDPYAAFRYPAFTILFIGGFLIHHRQPQPKASPSAGNSTSAPTPYSCSD
jgi:hypothetical protein